MNNEITTANAGAVQSPSGNMSDADFMQFRLGQPQKEEQPKEEVEEVAETQEPEVKVESEEIAEEAVAEEPEVESSDDVLSQLDLDSMSEAELKELSQKFGSRAVARFGELTAKRKAAEERVALLEAQLKDKSNPLDSAEKVENNPFESLDTIEKLQEKAKEINDIVEWADDILFQSDGYGADDVVTEIDGKEMTKAEVRKHLIQAKKAKTKFLPDQLGKVQAVEAAKQAEENFAAQAKEQLPWLSGNDNDVRTQYEGMIGDDRYKETKDQIRKINPAVAAQLDFLMAHAANSLYGKKPVVEKKGSIKLDPPTSGVPSVAKSEKSESKRAKAIKELSSNFSSSGSISDFVKLRTLSHSKQ